jgi:hypothetical protein
MARIKASLTACRPPAHTTNSGINIFRIADGKIAEVKAPEIGVWFKHFRQVKDVTYYTDFVTNARSRKTITMTNTISPLHDSSSKSYQLIEEWFNAP